MSLGVVEEQYIQDIADAIREKAYLDESIVPADMSVLIADYLRNPQGTLSMDGKDLSKYYDYGYINVDVADYNFVDFHCDSVGLVPENIISGKTVLGVSGTAVAGPDTCTVLFRNNLTQGGVQIRWVNSDWSGYSFYELPAQQTLSITVGGNSIIAIASTVQSMGSPSMDNCNGISAKYSYEWSQAFHCSAGGSGTIWIQRG